jgi:hypothetical protein
MIGLDILQLKDKIRIAIDATRMYNYRLNWLYLLPKLNLDDKYGYEIRREYILLGQGNGRMIIPLITDHKRMYSIILSELEKGGLANIPHYYTQNLGTFYKITPRMWGEHDFVYETAQMMNTPGGKLKRIQQYVHAHKRNENLVVINLSENLNRRQEFIDAVYLWHDEIMAIGLKKAVGRLAYPEWVINNFDELNKHVDVKGIGIYDKSKSKMVAVGLGTEHSTTYWVHTFGFASRNYQDLSAYVKAELASQFIQYPYTLDGDAGGEANPLYAFKSKYLTTEVTDKQLKMKQVVKRRS